MIQLDQIGKTATKTDGAEQAEQEERKPLPTESVVLLLIIPCVWILIAGYKAWEKKKAKGKN